MWFNYINLSDCNKFFTNQLFHKTSSWESNFDKSQKRGKVRVNRKCNKIMFYFFINFDFSSSKWTYGINSILQNYHKKIIRVILFQISCHFTKDHVPGCNLLTLRIIVFQLLNINYRHRNKKIQIMSRDSFHFSLFHLTDTVRKI